jgi:lariat debranching enzyme
MKIAVEGCCHGELDKIYAAMKHLEEKEAIKIDLLICCGDFQAVRNLNDLECMSVPNKYKTLGTFHKYYSGEVVAPYPTLFIGGNHEASNYLWELYYGGFVAPNIYYTGHSGVINFGDLRIGGLSGIYKSHDFNKPHYERPPYRNNEVKSAYHVRRFDVEKLAQITENLDVFLSHDWPRNIAKNGNTNQLIKKKPFLASEIADQSLGSPPAEELLYKLKPAFWFSAHLHVKFAAVVEHSDDGETKKTESSNEPSKTKRTTKFLALDKCLPKRDFMQIIDFPDKKSEGGFWLDHEWLSILKANHDRHGVGVNQSVGRGEDASVHRQWVDAKLSRASNERNPPPEFEATAPAHDLSDRRKPGQGTAPIGVTRNPQTVKLLDMLELDFKLDAPVNGNFQNNRGGGSGYPPPPSTTTTYSIPRDGPFGTLQPPRNLPPQPRVQDTNEISLGSDDE